ncbi:MAG: pyruvate dehydrogenase (acetyl-transferring), homodimeric type [Pseudomonadota bacterium]
MSSPPMNRDPDWENERAEWIDSIAYVLENDGPVAAREIFEDLHDYLQRHRAAPAPSLGTPYRNSVSVEDQPVYPGDIDLESRIEEIIRWNAMAMVLRANDASPGLGGHIATYGSAATLFEVAFNHFLRARSERYGGDIVYFQAHASPGIYARAFLEGRLSEAEVGNFRRELQPNGGLSSYPHPHNMPTFWQAPTASMGLSTVSAIYQARFARYLENRGLKEKNGGKVWAFIGDGEADEPEVLGTVGIAARERLDNLVLVVNCNLQRLDGPVRGNGKIIQELEQQFLGAGWNVIKVIWGTPWDALFARDANGVLQRRMDEVLDGEYQMYTVLGGDEQREHWVNGNAELRELMKTLSDEEVRTIKRGGFDHLKLFAAYERAMQTTDRPSVVLIKTVKGYGLGPSAEGRNNAHQKKDFSPDERVEIAQRFAIPISAKAAKAAKLYRPAAGSREMEYLKARREALGGFLPTRTALAPKLTTPPLERFAPFLEGSGDRSLSTTMALVRMLARLLRDPDVGPYVVPIVPDEARTFGMDGLFRQAGIYSPEGQNYRPVDADTMMPYRESEEGQILQEGICESGALASFLAAGTAYSHHGIPTIPFYIFYSIFGFQRVGDLIWACGDSLCRGFLLGGTSGRTTLNGEGLQHQDGHSHVVASTLPNLVSYDPAFAYELVIIIRDGIRRMYAEQEDIFYYITVTNENIVMPSIPDGVEEGILRGLYKFKAGPKTRGRAKAHLLGSGAIISEVMAAQALLAELGVSADIWSVTSYNELRRDALDCERWNRMHPTQTPKESYLERTLNDEDGVFVAASDYMSLLPQGISAWVPGGLTALGTDGYGLSESREALRDHFEVDARHIAAATLHRLFREKRVSAKLVKEAYKKLDINADKPRSW